jgi:outer membrane lipoprotein-sorting protein
MKISKILVFIVLIIPFTLKAQVAESDKKAKEILNSVSTRYKSYKSIKATFRITSENTRDKKKDVRNGVLYVKGNSYKLEIAGQEIISDGKTRWTFVEDANEVQIDHLRTDQNSITPANIFTMYEKGWNSKFMGEQKSGALTYQLIELVPTDPGKKNVFKVKLTINKQDKFISSAQIFDKNGSIQLISVEKFSPDAATDENIYLFSASKYPGAEVIDLR